MKLLSSLTLLRRKGRGRARTRPLEVTADGAYDSEGIREYLRRRAIKGNIPGNERSRIKPRMGRPTRFHKLAYRMVRSSVERFFGWLKGFRRLATRYERLATTFLGFIHIACFIITWKVLQ